MWSTGDFDQRKPPLADQDVDHAFSLSNITQGKFITTVPGQSAHAAAWGMAATTLDIPVVNHNQVCCCLFFKV